MADWDDREIRMGAQRVLLTAALALLGCAVSAQDLGEAARKERARRAQVEAQGKPVRSFADLDLPTRPATSEPDPPPSPDPTPVEPGPSAGPTPRQRLAEMARQRDAADRAREAAAEQRRKEEARPVGIPYNRCGRVRRLPDKG
jgi:hypothetical protein